MDLFVLKSLKALATLGLDNHRACKALATTLCILGGALGGITVLQRARINDLEARTDALETKLDHILEPIYEEEK